MREIGSVSDDLDVRGDPEARYIHIAPLWDAHFGEAGATLETTPRNARHRWGDGDALEAGATRESTVPNLRHRWGDRDARETGATRESIPPNPRHRWWDGDAREAGATRESTAPNLGHRWGDRDARETGATRESTVSNHCHRWGDDGVLTSTYKRIAPRMYYGIAILSGVIDFVVLGNGDALEAGATIESPVPNLRYR